MDNLYMAIGLMYGALETIAVLNKDYNIPALLDRVDTYIEAASIPNMKFIYPAGTK